ncbi:MAG: CocE/NonD family hydrolase [Sodalis sp. (in: enterobacteria)]|uniref:CocE/NonD family hydrolase n=1 Tax=Sodalis sp. (in: enterobacteria) TaxID=1898979 RepID=UPI003F329CF2
MSQASFTVDFSLQIASYRQIFVPLPDGPRLAARLWLLEHAPPEPLVLEWIPYWQSDNTATGDAMMHGVFPTHGIAALRIDLRGSGNSDGLQRDEYLAQEQDDAVEVIAWRAHSERDAFWRGSICEDCQAIECAVYAVGGWTDGYCDAILRLMQHLDAPRKGLIVPWTHVYPTWGGVPGPAIDFLGECLRFWRRWLLGEETGIMGEPMLRLWQGERLRTDPRGITLGGHWLSTSGWPASYARVTFGVHRLTRPKSVAPGESFRVRLLLKRAAYRSSAGCRRQLALSTAYWPMVWAEPGQGPLQLWTDDALLQLPGPGDAIYRRRAGVWRAVLGAALSP